MDVKWNVSNEPNVDRWGISKQQVLLTNRGTYTTGYWDKKNTRWLVDGILLSSEVIMAWLEGITNEQQNFI